MLTGTELLAKVKELGEASRTELVRATGYVRPKKDGGERLLFSAFYDALLEARGITLGRAPGEGKAGRRLSYATKVQFNGNLMVGKAYTALIDLKPGDAFQIQLGRRQIKLIPMDAPHEPEDGSSPDPVDEQVQQEQQKHQDQQDPQEHHEHLEHLEQGKAKRKGKQNHKHQGEAELASPTPA
jgi:hypothetical protein